MLTVSSSCDIHINGFPLADLDDNRNNGKSVFLTQYLLSGDNLLTCSLTAGENATANSQLEAKIFSAPKGQPRPDDGGTLVVEVALEVEELSVNPDELPSELVLVGGHDAVTGAMDFEFIEETTDGVHVYEWGRRLQSGEEFDRQPSHMRIEALRQALDSISIELRGALEGEKVVLGPLSVSPEAGSVVVPDSDSGPLGFTVGEVIVRVESESALDSTRLALDVGLGFFVGSKDEECTFTVPGVPASWAWQGGDQIPQLDQQVRNEIQLYVDGIGARLEAGDVNALVDDFGPKIEDYALAIGTTEAAMTQNFNAFFSPVVANPVDLVAIDWPSVQFRVIQDKIVHVRAADGAPILQVTGAVGPNGETGPLSLDLFLARIGGVWKVVR